MTILVICYIMSFFHHLLPVSFRYLLLQQPLKGDSEQQNNKTLECSLALLSDSNTVHEMHLARLPLRSENIFLH